jgi:hypothetical protein
MRITVRVPDDLGEEVKHRTDNVSAYVVEALTEKLERERRRVARQEILERAKDGGPPDEDLHAINQRERRDGDRDFRLSEEE